MNLVYHGLIIKWIELAKELISIKGNIYKIKSNNKFRENFIKHFSEKLFTDNSKFMI
jgi:hypothetical protein